MQELMIKILQNKIIHTSSAIMAMSAELLVGIKALPAILS
jgi:hypothetical protein